MVFLPFVWEISVSAIFVPLSQVLALLPEISSDSALDLSCPEEVPKYQVFCGARRGDIIAASNLGKGVTEIRLSYNPSYW